jgi:hypothetical protein
MRVGVTDRESQEFCEVNLVLVCQPLYLGLPMIIALLSLPIRNPIISTQL